MSLILDMSFKEGKKNGLFVTAFYFNFPLLKCRNYYRTSRMLESIAGYRTIFLFAVSCKTGALECNTY